MAKKWLVQKKKRLRRSAMIRILRVLVVVIGLVTTLSIVVLFGHNTINNDLPLLHDVEKTMLDSFLGRIRGSSRSNRRQQRRQRPQTTKPTSRRPTSSKTNGTTTTTTAITTATSFTRPRFVIHVGPAKTATTSIQHDLVMNAAYMRANDGYAYLGKYISPAYLVSIRNKIIGTNLNPNCKQQMDEYYDKQQLNNNRTTTTTTTTTNTSSSSTSLPDCYRTFLETLYNDKPYLDTKIQKTIVEDYDCHKQIETAYQQHVQQQQQQDFHSQDIPCWKALMDELDVHHAQNESIIISNEDFSMGLFHNPALRGNRKSYWIALQQALRKFDVTIVITYRRYSQWLVSAKKQWDKECLYNLYNDPEAKLWPQQGGRRCHEPNWSTYNTFRKQKKAYRYHYTDQNMQLWEQYFPNSVRLINYHDDSHNKSITSVLLCDVLRDQTPNTCQLSLNQTSETTHNVKEDTYYESIVFEAAQKGLINTTTRTRKDVVDELKKVQQKLGHKPTDLPMICPSKEDLKILLKESLAYEKQIMPDFYATKAGKAQHRKEFWDDQVTTNKEFCEIDTNALFKNKKSWDDVLAGLSTTTTVATSS